MESGGLTQIDWSTPWFAPWRDVGERVQARWRDEPLHEALNRGADGSLRFVAQDELPPGEAYEAHIFHTRTCPTRDNLHDFFNGLCWQAFPQAKRQLNRLQAHEIATGGVGAARGPVRDAITVFDENGALLQAPQPLWDALLARDWHKLFIDLRPVWADAKLTIFGHALLEKLVIPRKDLTAHAPHSLAIARTRPTIDRQSHSVGRLIPA